MIEAAAISLMASCNSLPWKDIGDSHQEDARKIARDALKAALAQHAKDEEIRPLSPTRREIIRELTQQSQDCGAYGTEPKYGRCSVNRVDPSHSFCGDPAPAQQAQPECEHGETQRHLVYTNPHGGPYISEPDHECPGPQQAQPEMPTCGCVGCARKAGRRIGNNGPCLLRKHKSQ